MQTESIFPQATSSLAVWLDHLEHLHGQAIELGLERIQNVANKLALCKPAPLIFTVAGTNGKGTTCCMLESILLAAGFRVGVYSSPHLLRYTERVRIQGKELAESAHCQAFAFINAHRGTTSLTYFEFGTLAALHLLQQARVDVAILEVGLGGRLDATNIVETDVAVITSIALDHTDWLGTDRESIGREKAGIFRQGKPAVVGETDIPASVWQVAQTAGAVLYPRCAHGEAATGWRLLLDEQHWTLQTEHHCYSDLPLPQIPLSNAATAVAALHYAGILATKISPAALKQGIKSASLAGRFQRVGENPTIILDVAHNPHAAAYLADRLAEWVSVNKVSNVRAIVGMLADKDIAGTLACLSPQIDVWYCAPLPTPRTASAERLAALLPVSVQQKALFSSVSDAFQQARQEAQPSDILIVCGSFYTVAEVMQMLITVEEHGQ